MINSIPWVEKYRPNCFNNIVLDAEKRHIFENIINNKTYFPNLIFFGPPGTGKTTTIINVINAYHSYINAPLIIHLNASDERGIDIIRTHISQFVTSKGLFQEGVKFIILDEIDYMTRTAQLALKYLIEHTTHLNVRFCLICNYISKIDSALSQNFVMFRFNSHPKNEVFSFINNILIKEKINVSAKHIDNIIDTYNSDLRSMINYIQLNRQTLESCRKSIDEQYIILKNINDDSFLKNSKSSHTNKIQFLKEFANDNLQNASDLLRNIINHIFLNKKNTNTIDCDFLLHASHVYQNINIDQDVLILYFFKYIL